MNSSVATVTLAELAARVGGTIEGDGSVTITGAAPIEKAVSGDISFVANPRYKQHVAGTGASALVLEAGIECTHIPVLRHERPYLAFAQIIDILYPDQILVQPGTDSSAVISPQARIGSGSGIGPLCHIREGAVIGRNCQLISSVYVGRNVTIGDNCLIYPGARILRDSVIGNNVTIHASTVIGSDGFGYAESPTGLKKIKQIGWVEIEDDVEIGSNCSIDRGALGPTRIGQGTKVDNLVQIAHNVEIGHHCIIVSQVGISGSTRIGNGVILAGQVGVVGHLEIEDGVRVGAQSGVAHSVAAGKTVFGTPAREAMQTKRIEAALSRLPDLFKRVRRLESKDEEG